MVFIKYDIEDKRQNCYGVKGRWLLSYNDCEYIRELYEGFNITEVQRNNNLSNTTNKQPYKELIIKNY